jgi:hypothetical protein
MFCKTSIQDLCKADLDEVMERVGAPSQAVLTLFHREGPALRGNGRTRLQLVPCRPPICYTATPHHARIVPGLPSAREHHSLEGRGSTRTEASRPGARLLTRARGSALHGDETPAVKHAVATEPSWPLLGTHSMTRDECPGELWSASTCHPLSLSAPAIHCQPQARPASCSLDLSSPLASARGRVRRLAPQRCIYAVYMLYICCI